MAFASRRYELKYAFPEGVPFSVDDRSSSDYSAPGAESGSGAGCVVLSVREKYFRQV